MRAVVWSLVSGLALAGLAAAPRAAALDDDVPTLSRVRAEHAIGDYAGLWTPDHEANRQLAKAMRKKMRKAMAAMRPSERAVDRKEPGGMGGPGPGGMGGPPGGMGGMGGPPGGMPPGGPPPMPEPDAAGVLREDMDFAAPLQGDLAIAATDDSVSLGRADGEPVRLVFASGARELGADGATRAFAAWDGGALVVELNTDDGVSVTHTYTLEGGGERLRVRTVAVGGATPPVPGGLQFERLYRRAAGP